MKFNYDFTSLPVLLAAFVFHAPVAWVFLAAMTENLVKNSLGFWRFFSRRWIRDLAAPPQPATS